MEQIHIRNPFSKWTFGFGVLVALSASLAWAGDPPHWDYEGAEGPENWGKLAPDFALCGTGANQSPINITHAVKAEHRPIRFAYTTTATDVVNNGHTVQTNFAPGSKMFIDGQEFELKQVHFHAPSENQIEGHSFPMEGHLVHADKDGNLAVVAVMFEQGKKNPAIAKLFAEMPANAGDKAAFKGTLKAEELLPKGRDYFRFSGSLTTPPCSEGVLWLVMKQPVTAEPAQVEVFSHALHHTNNRPIQALHSRSVLK
jgi:carbonic anhydrase